MNRYVSAHAKDVRCITFRGALTCRPHSLRAAALQGARTGTDALRVIAPGRVMETQDGNASKRSPSGGIDPSHPKAGPSDRANALERRATWWRFSVSVAKSTGDSDWAWIERQQLLFGRPTPARLSRCMRWSMPCITEPVPRVVKVVSILREHCDKTRRTARPIDSDFGGGRATNRSDKDKGAPHHRDRARQRNHTGDHPHVRLGGEGLRWDTRPSRWAKGGTPYCTHSARDAPWYG